MTAGQEELERMAEQSRLVADAMAVKLHDPEGELVAALAQLQAELPHPKRTAVNDFTGKAYAPLGECLDSALPLLKQHGIALLQVPQLVGVLQVTVLRKDRGGGWKRYEGIDVARYRMVTQLQKGSAYLRADIVADADGVDPHSVSSLLTHLRRYGLGIIGLVQEDDDDGNEATERTSAKQTAAKRTRKPRQTPAAVHAATGQDPRRSEPQEPKRDDKPPPRGEVEEDSALVKAWQEAISKALLEFTGGAPKEAAARLVDATKSGTFAGFSDARRMTKLWQLRRCAERLGKDGITVKDPMA